MRGLAEKIWKVLPPIRAAVSAAFSSDLAMEVCAPIRKLDNNNPGLWGSKRFALRVQFDHANLGAAPWFNHRAHDEDIPGAVSSDQFRLALISNVDVVRKHLVGCGRDSGDEKDAQKIVRMSEAIS
jgi:hypothetical protein